MAQASAKSLNMFGLPKRKEWPQSHKVSSWQGRKNRLCQKEKEQCHLYKSPDHEMGESQGEREPYLDKRDEDRRGNVERKW